MEQLGFTLDDIYRLMLIMFRTGALVMTVPVFGHVSIPRTLRVLFIVVIAVMLFPSAFVSSINIPRTMLELTIVIFSELAAGFVMGFTVVLIFAAVQFAGHLIGLQMGLAVANVIDPMGAGQISVVAEFYYMFSLLMFLVVNGHHMVIIALVKSFEMVPVGGAVFGGALQDLFVRLTFMVFVVGVKLAAPVIVVLYLSNLVLGIIARTVPQMNVFIIGFPLGIAAGLAMIAASFPFFFALLNKMFHGLEGDLATIITILSGG